MGKACGPKQQAANLVAHAQASGGDIFSEAERRASMSGEQKAYYERVMANKFGIKPKGKDPSFMDAVEKHNIKIGGTTALKDVAKNPRKILVDEQIYANPSKMFSARFYGSIDRRIENWYKKQKQARKPADLPSYMEAVGKPAGKVLRQLEKDVINANSRAQLNSAAAKYGLTGDTLYAGREYLRYIAEGGHLVTTTPGVGGWIFKGLQAVGGGIAKATSGFNGLYILGNAADLQRAYSYYLTRDPGALGKVLEGSLNALKATKSQPWRRIPELDKKGLYESQYLDRGSKIPTPFEMSINVQKNMVYHLDKAMGGNGFDGVRDQLFDSKPWDRPAWDRIKNTKLIFDLARYPINETRWLAGQLNDLAKLDPRAAANLALYSVSRAYLFGAGSMIPFKNQLSKDSKEGVSEFDDAIGANAVKQISREAFSVLGLDLQLELDEYLSPGGGQLGSRLASFTNWGGRAAKGLRAGEDVIQGNFPAATARLAQTAMAASMLTGWGKLAGTPVQLQNMVDTLASELEGEFKKPGRFEKELVKDNFGGIVKKAQ